jgi:hypothetical protein
MNPNLEDQLHALADDLSAPPSDDVRSSIGRRTHRLRRRRQTRRAVGGGALVVLVVAGLLALQNAQEGAQQPTDPIDQPDVSTGQDDPGGDLPTWTVELPAWDVVAAEEFVDVQSQSQVVPVDVEGMVAQVFRSGDDPLGATVVSRHWSSSDVPAPPEGAETVQVDDAEGQLVSTGPDRYTLQWSPGNGDSTASLDAYGLSEDQLLELAGSLVPRDDSLSYPPSADDTFGFETTDLPGDLQEVPLQFERQPWDVRRIDASRGTETLSVEVNNHGGATYEATFAAMLTRADSVEEVDVDGHAAHLFVDPSFPEAGTVAALWQQDDATIVVTLKLPGVEVGPEAPDDLRAVLDSLRELSATEWADLAESYG